MLLFQWTCFILLLSMVMIRHVRAMPTVRLVQTRLRREVRLAGMVVCPCELEPQHLTPKESCLRARGGTGALGRLAYCIYSVSSSEMS